MLAKEFQTTNNNVSGEECLSASHNLYNDDNNDNNDEGKV